MNYELWVHGLWFAVCKIWFVRRAFVVFGSRLPGPMVLGSGFLVLGSRFLDPSALVSGSRFSRFRVFKGLRLSGLSILGSWFMVLSSQPLTHRPMMNGPCFSLFNPQFSFCASRIGHTCCLSKASFHRLLI